MPGRESHSWCAWEARRDFFWSPSVSWLGRVAEADRAAGEKMSEGFDEGFEPLSGALEGDADWEFLDGGG